MEPKPHKDDSKATIIKQFRDADIFFIERGYKVGDTVTIVKRLTDHDSLAREDGKQYLYEVDKAGYPSSRMFHGELRAIGNYGCRHRCQYCKGKCELWESE